MTSIADLIVSRRDFLENGGTLFSGLSMIPSLTSDAQDDDALLLHEIKLLSGMADNTFKQLWINLGGITEKELDWKPNKESNSTRWVIGHLYWFEEWLADTIEKKGRYLTDKKPTSIQDISFQEVKMKFEIARNRVSELSKSLNPEQIKSEINYVGRFDLPIRELLQVHVLHMSGHRYQIRYIRGTYSRVHHTNKADFDPW